MSCEHKNIVPPPPGKHLRICLDCCKRLIECDNCDAKLTAGPHVADSGWEKWWSRDGDVECSGYRCPACR